MKLQSVDELAEKMARNSTRGASVWAESMRPYFKALEKLKLPPRGKRCSKRNVRRCQLVVECMMNTRRKIAQGKA